MQAALRLLPAAMFKGTAYGALPTAASIGAVERADVVAAHANWSPAGSTLIVAGAMPAAEAQALAERLFGEWRSDRTASVRPKPVTGGAPRGGARVVTDGDAGLGLAFLVLGMAAADQVTIDDQTGIEERFPDFVSAFERIGASFVRYAD